MLVEQVFARTSVRCHFLPSRRPATRPATRPAGLAAPRLRAWRGSEPSRSAPARLCHDSAMLPNKKLRPAAQSGAGSGARSAERGVEAGGAERSQRPAEQGKGGAGLRDSSEPEKPLRGLVSRLRGF